MTSKAERSLFELTSKAVEAKYRIIELHQKYPYLELNGPLAGAITRGFDQYFRERYDLDVDDEGNLVPISDKHYEEPDKQLGQDYEDAKRLMYSAIKSRNTDELDLVWERLTKQGFSKDRITKIITSTINQLISEGWLMNENDT